MGIRAFSFRRKIDYSRMGVNIFRWQHNGVRVGQVKAGRRLVAKR